MATSVDFETDITFLDRICGFNENFEKGFVNLELKSNWDCSGLKDYV